jgi:hypothetical protein
MISYAVTAFEHGGGRGERGEGWLVAAVVRMVLAEAFFFFSPAVTSSEIDKGSRLLH